MTIGRMHGSAPTGPLKATRRSLGGRRRRARLALGFGVMAVLASFGFGAAGGSTVLAGTEGGVVAAAGRAMGFGTSPVPAREHPVAASDDDQGVGDPVEGEMIEDEDPVPTALLAQVDALQVRVPSLDHVAIGFHEASTENALELQPLGSSIANNNTTKFDAPGGVLRGADYVVMASRGRRFPATSAVDMVLRDDEPVVAPVSGVVSDVRSYWLYGEHEDHRIEIVPDDAPHLRVVLVHARSVRVAAGDRVTVGTSVIADSVNRFPFTSQIDRETEPDRFGHVHLEVQPVDAPRPGG